MALEFKKPNTQKKRMGNNQNSKPTSASEALWYKGFKVFSRSLRFSDSPIFFLSLFLVFLVFQNGFFPLSTQLRDAWFLEEINTILPNYPWSVQVNYYFLLGCG
jgi:hypothetical protein